jgi:quercetin dioxygenase-like cupin family protein
MADGPRVKVVNLRDAPASAITVDGASGVVGLPLLELAEGTGQFDVRGVRIAPGGVSADHAHPWEQANYVLSGHGRVDIDGTGYDVGPDDFVYVPPNAQHVFTNTGDEQLVLLAARGPRV